MKNLCIVAALALCLAACAVPAAGSMPTGTSSPSPAPAYTSTPQSTATRPALTRTPSPTPPAICLVETGSETGTVYIRRGPGMNWPVAGYAIQGERLELTGQSDPAGWAEIRQAGELAGWFYVSKWCKK